jgi:hypothetical protein
MDSVINIKINNDNKNNLKKKCGCKTLDKQYINQNNKNECQCVFNCQSCKINGCKCGGSNCNC